MREQEEAATREDQGEQDTGQDGGASMYVILTHRSCGSSSVLASVWRSPVPHSPCLESPAGTGEQAVVGTIAQEAASTGEEEAAGKGEQVAAGTIAQEAASTHEEEAVYTGEQAVAGTIAQEATITGK